MATVQPAPAGPDQLAVGDEHLVEDDLVELGVTGDLDQRADLDAVGVHVDDQAGQPLLALGGVGVAPGQAQTPIGELRIGGPHLVSGDQPPAVGRARPGW